MLVLLRVGEQRDRVALLPIRFDHADVVPVRHEQLPVWREGTAEPPFRRGYGSLFSAGKVPHDEPERVWLVVEREELARGESRAIGRQRSDEVDAVACGRTAPRVRAECGDIEPINRAAKAE